jgi:DNA end-binding protein Ku
VKEVWYCVKEDKPIKRSEMVKGYEASKGHYVLVEEEELKQVAPPTASTMDVLQFVKEEEVDPLWFERSYYVASDEKIAKPYVLFEEALRQSKRSAIVKITMHSRENVAIMRISDRGLLLHTLYYSDELHQAKMPAPAHAKTSPKELTLAKQLVEQLSGSFKPEEFHDTYRENVQKLLERKRKGQEPIPIQQVKNTKVVDLMEALQQSLKHQAAASNARTKNVQTKKSGRRSRVA